MGSAISKMAGANGWWKPPLPAAVGRSRLPSATEYSSKSMYNYITMERRFQVRLFFNQWCFLAGNSGRDPLGLFFRIIPSEAFKAGSFVNLYYRRCKQWLSREFLEIMAPMRSTISYKQAKLSLTSSKLVSMRHHQGADSMCPVTKQHCKSFYF